MNTFPSQTLLSFDFGMKRIGVAVGQTVTQSARPLCTLDAKQGMPPMDQLQKLIREWQPSALVIGVPLNMDGTEQNITHLARRFSKLLRDHFHLPVHEMDERLTTCAAREYLFEHGGYKALQKGKIDAFAAQAILQSWFNHQKIE